MLINLLEKIAIPFVLIFSTTFAAPLSALETQLTIVGINSDVIENSSTVGGFYNQFPILNGGVLPTPGQDGSTGYVGFLVDNLPKNPHPLDPILANIADLPSDFANLGPKDLGKFPGIVFYNVALTEAKIDTKRSDVKELQKILKKAGTPAADAIKLRMDLVKANWWLNPWELNPFLNDLNPLFASCEGTEFTLNSALENNGWVLSFCNLGGNIIPNWFNVQFFLDDKPFRDAGIISKNEKFEPFVIFTELLPLKFPNMLQEINTILDVKDAPCNGTDPTCASDTWTIHVKIEED